MNLPWKKTKKGLISSMYDNQTRRSREKGFPQPTYSKKWLQTKLLLDENYHRLYDVWLLSGFKKDLVPSIDRKDDYIGYTEYNIQLMTWGENNAKGIADRNSGKNKKKLVKVQAYTKSGKLIKKYDSIKEAAKETVVSKTSIANCLSGLSKTAGGYVWQYTSILARKVG